MNQQNENSEQGSDIKNICSDSKIEMTQSHAMDEDDNDRSILADPTQTSLIKKDGHNIFRQDETHSVQYHKVNQQDTHSLKISTDSQKRERSDSNHSAKSYGKEHPHNKKNYLKTIIAISVLFTIYISQVYLVEHECKLNTDDCMEFVGRNVKKWVSLILLNGLGLLSVFLFAINKKIDKIFIFICVIEYIYLAYIKYDINMRHIGLKNYEAGQSAGLTLAILIWSTLFFIYWFPRYLWRKNKYLICVLLFALASFIGYIYLYINNSCDGWEKGITGQIEFETPYCNVSKPKYCWPNILDGVFNFAADTCEINPKKIQDIKYKALNLNHLISDNEDKAKVTQKMKDINYLAWPVTNQLDKKYRNPDDIPQGFIKQTTVVSSVEDGFEKGKEVVVDLNQMELNIKVTRNETLVQERKEYNEKMQVNSLAKNIVIVYIDALSRAQAHRKLPLTQKFLKEHLQNQKEKIHEFYRFHSIDKKTLNNAFKLHFDVMISEILQSNKIEDILSEEKKSPNLIQEFKDAGYIVAHSSNTCTSQCLFRQKFQHLEKYFDEGIAHHEFLLYDPLYINQQNYFDIFYGPGSLLRRCIYGHDTNKFQFDYANQFMKEYKDEKKVVFFEFTDSHEITEEIVYYLDANLESFLRNMEQEGYFQEETAVYFLSDHGQHLLQAFYIKEKTQEKLKKQKQFKYQNGVFEVERMLPLFQMFMSEKMYEKLSDNEKAALEDNEQVIFGMGQVRNTIMGSAYGNKQEKYQDSLYKKQQENKSCYDINMLKDLDQELFCQCRPQEGLHL